ncbi:endonuclease [Spirochaetia bacterium]|nr:endonuclease [Spirochaetia bacterium]
MQKFFRRFGGWVLRGKLRRLLPLCMLPLLLAGVCGLPDWAGAGKGSPRGSLRVLSWNVQTLFDGEQVGNEYTDYLNEAGWAEEKYSARISSISRAIEQIDGGPPDVLALMEIENLQCLKDLARGELARYGYNWAYFAGNKGMSQGLGVLSRIPITEVRLHGMVWDQETVPRPVLEVWLRPEDAPLVLFVCHWKSKLGGEDETETLRRASARIILRRIREIRAVRPDVPAVIMGDLNENHDDFYRREGKILSALLPDDPAAADIINADFTGAGNRDSYLVLSGEKPPMAANFDAAMPAFYSPWGQEMRNGSYYYKNNWETIDHFLLTEQFFDEAGWDFSGCRVLAEEPFINSKGTPNRYNPRSGYGLSDHLPLMLELTNFTKPTD